MQYQPQTRLNDPRAFVWLALALVLTPFSFGPWLIPLAVWIGPIFILRFIRSQSFWRGMGIWYVAATVPLYFQLQNVVPMPQPAYTIFVLIASLMWMLIYVADRLLTPRLPGFLGTLVYPAAVVALEYLNAFGEWGSFGNLAYTQIEVLPLIQLASVTGMWGVIFLVSWPAALVNWLWATGWQWSRFRAAVPVVAAIYLAVFGYGYWRLVNIPDPQQVIRVAAFPSDALGIVSAMRYLDPASTTPLDEARAELAQSNDRLLARSRAEARAGARAIAWAEANAVVFQQDEAALMQAGQALASEEEIYLLMAVAVFRPEEEKILENKLILVEPSGNIAWEYWKAFPVPGPEAEASVPGSTDLPILDSELGRMAGVICFDMDHHYFLQEAGRAGVDLLFAPSNDWAEIARLHAQQAVFRAVENGFTLVRPTSNGISVAADPYGRVLGESDDFVTGGGALVVNVPVRHVSTLYSVIGDSVAWAAVAVLLACLVTAVVPFGRRREVG